MIAKYNIPNIRLFLEDAATFTTLAPASKDEYGDTIEADKGTQKKERETEKEKEKEEKAEEKQLPAVGHKRKARQETKKVSGELMASRWRKKRKRQRRDPGELPNVFYAYPMAFSMETSQTCKYNKVCPSPSPSLSLTLTLR